MRDLNNYQEGASRLSKLSHKFCDVYVGPNLAETKH
jgi:hypothetical protein